MADAKQGYLGNKGVRQGMKQGVKLSKRSGYDMRDGDCTRVRDIWRV